MVRGTLSLGSPSVQRHLFSLGRTWFYFCTVSFKSKVLYSHDFLHSRPNSRRDGSLLFSVASYGARSSGSDLPTSLRHSLPGRDAGCSPASPSFLNSPCCPAKPSCFSLPVMTTKPPLWHFPLGVPSPSSPSLPFLNTCPAVVVSKNSFFLTPGGGKPKIAARANSRKAKSPGPGLSSAERPPSVSSVHSEGDCNRRTPLTNRVWEDRPSSAGNGPFSGVHLAMQVCGFA